MAQDQHRSSPRTDGRTPAGPREGRRAARSRHRVRLRRRRLIIAGVIVAGVALVVGSIVWLGLRALAAKDALEQAQGQIRHVQDVLTSGGTIEQTYGDLREQTAIAKELTSDPVWWLAERVPVLGANFAAVGATARVVDGIVVDAVGPIAAIPGLSLESLKPVDGAIDLDLVRRAVPALVSANQALLVAQRDMAGVSTDYTLEPVADAVTTLQDLLVDATAVTAPVAEFAPYIPAALGADGTRNYLLLFQNNAEERSTGGNPAALALITVDQGHISMTAQASSANFENPYDAPVIDVPQEARELYGDLMSTYVQNITFTPDFPLTARMAQAMWQRSFGQPVDGVVSLDPVALSYLLEATGPIPISTGDSLESGSVVDFLLSSVYARYEDPAVQDLVFADAAKGVFDAMVTGQASVRGTMDAATKMIDDGRLMVWSGREEEEAVLSTTPIAGTMPASNAPLTTVGVFFNDRTVSKMSYFLDAAIEVSGGRCAADGALLTRTSVALTNTTSAELVLGLPDYVTGGGYIPGTAQRLARGQILDYVAVYGPIGASIGEITVDGVASSPTVAGTDGGRPVAILGMLLDPGASHTLTVDMIGGTDASDDLAVRSTPRVGPTPTTIGALACG